MANNDIIIRPIEPGDICTGFSFGDRQFQPLKAFIKNKAKPFHEQNLARTHIAVESASLKAVAYITLVCGQIDASNGVMPDDKLGYPYSFFPAVKIARLGVDKRQQGQGLGKALVEMAVGIAINDIMPKVGCRFVVVDAKTPAVAFYESMGFTLIDTRSNRNRTEPVMYLDLHKASGSA